MLKLGKYSASVTIVSGGGGTISIKVPGSFATVDKSSSGFSGMELRQAAMFFGNPTAGDYVKRITLQDTDGVMSVQAKALFPSYPIIADSSSVFANDADKGGYLNPNLPMIYAPTGQSQLVPSGLYIVVDVQKASAVADTFYASVLWDDRT